MLDAIGFPDETSKDPPSGSRAPSINFDRHLHCIRLWVKVGWCEEYLLITVMAN